MKSIFLLAMLFVTFEAQANEPQIQCDANYQEFDPRGILKGYTSLFDKNVYADMPLTAQYKGFKVKVNIEPADITTNHKLFRLTLKVLKNDVSSGTEKTINIDSKSFDSANAFLIIGKEIVQITCYQNLN